MQIKKIFLLLFLVLLVSCEKKIISTNQDIFFPKEISNFIKTFESFDLGMWNYIIVDTSKDIESLCDELKLMRKSHFEKVMCAPELSDHAPLLNSYLRDQYFIFKAPSSYSLLESSTHEMSKLSMFMGEEGQKLLKLTRIDPMNFKESFFEKIKKLSNNDFSWIKGVLSHLDSKKSVIPVQFSYSPNNFTKTDELYNILNKYNSILIGRHQGFYGNRTQIEKDLKSVTMATITLMAIFLIFLYFNKLHSTMLLFVPIGVGILSACLVVILSYGSIHGLTLSFGVGIIGLSLDYGIHALLGENSKRVWTSNLFGLVTTGIVFIIFFFSQVPLLRQMMLFSVVGLIVSFLSTKIFIKYIKIKGDFKVRFPTSKIFLALGVIPLLALFTLPFVNLNFDFNRFDYIKSDSKPIRDWFYKSWSKDKLFFKLYKKESIDELYKDFDHSKLIPINRESIASYLPKRSQLKSNLESWKKLLNEPKDRIISNERLFGPFFENIDNIGTFPLERSEPAKYLKHLVSKDSYISLWFSPGDKFSNQLKKSVIGIKSLSEIFVNFSRSISLELIILTPLTFISIILILLFRYRNLTQPLMCLFPFIFSLGLYLLVQRVFLFPISFMSIIGIFLIYGLSVDYGIFSTDFYVGDKESHFDLNSCLFVSWLSSIIGFLPLALCSHNVLKDLGLAIIIGLLGVWFSTFYILPSFYAWRKNEI